MLQAEKAMRDALAAQSLQDVATRFGRKVPDDFFGSVEAWVGDRMSGRTGRARPARESPG
jgi:hypothetical protein